jgi:hypothetical protein
MNLGGEQSIFAPGGPGAASIAQLGWIVFGVCIAVTAVMVALLFWVAPSIASRCTTIPIQEPTSA